MKKVFLFILCIALFTLFGCGAETVVATPPTAPATTEFLTRPSQEIETPIAVSNQPIVAIAVPAVTETYGDINGTPVLSHTYQTMHLTHPDPLIADEIILNYLTFMDEIHNEAQNIYNEIETYSPNSETIASGFSQILLDPQRVDPGVLSLFGTYAISSGNGHPSRTGVSLNYDVVNGFPLTLASIMTADATVDQICDLIIDALNEKSDSLCLYEDYPNTVDLKLSGDISLYQAFYFTNKGVCFYFDIYEIAPYSSGIISIEIPYEKLLGILSDAYFPAEEDTVYGQIFRREFDITSHDQYSTITEAILTEDATMELLYTDTLVRDLRIKTTLQSDSDTQYVAYAANRLQQDEAVVISATPEQLNGLEISFDTNFPQ